MAAFLMGAAAGADSGATQLFSGVQPFISSSTNWVNGPMPPLRSHLPAQPCTGPGSSFESQPKDILRLFVMGGQVIGESPTGWLEVTTTGAVLQPMVIALAIAFALPGASRARVLAFALAALLAFGFLLIDLPVALHAYVWDMFVDYLDTDRFSPLMGWHEFLHAGGRLGVAVILGLGGWRLARKAEGPHEPVWFINPPRCPYNFSLSPIGS